MKKLIAMMVVILCFMSAIAFADDFSGMSDAELLSKYLEIQSILLSRSQSYSIDLYAGKYTVGQDLPAGTYRLETKGAYSSSTLSIYKDSEAKYAANTYLMGELYNSSIIGKLDLFEGNIVNITGSTVTICIYNAAQIEMNTPMPTNGVNESTLSPIEGSIVVHAGKYLVGTEIPKGTYRVVCEDPYGMVLINVYESEKMKFPSYNTIISPFLGNEVIGKLELKTGEYFEVVDGDITLYVYDGIK